jgi:5-methylcytosine-specific restriction endonuclease McrA
MAERNSPENRNARGSQIRLKFGEDQRLRREEEVQVRCKGCGKTVLLPRWYTEKGVRVHFCSQLCRENWESSVHDGDTFRLELKGRPEHRGGNWTHQAGRARERDGYACQVCGITEEELDRKLDVHHKMPARTFGNVTDANRLSNLVSVCPSCHKREENAGREGLPLFDPVNHPGRRPGDAG